MDEYQKKEAERAHDKDDDSWHKSNEATISSATVTLRTCVLINGGAAVAMLAFISGLVKDRLLQGSSIGGATAPLIWFAVGVVAATLAMGFMYLVNFANTSILGARSQEWSPPYILETPRSQKWRIASMAFTIAAILCGIASIVFFVFGMLEIRDAISALKPNASTLP